MGKGDKKTKRGKIIIGSYGVRRRHKTKKASVIQEKAKEIEVKPAEEVKIAVEPVIPAEVIVEKKLTKKTVAKKTADKAAEGESRPKVSRPRKKAKPKAEAAAEESKAEEPKTEA